MGDIKDGGKTKAGRRELYFIKYCQAKGSEHSRYYNDIFKKSIAKSKEFKRMFEFVVKHGTEIKPPSHQEIRVNYLKQLIEDQSTFGRT